ncbi:MAG: cupin domain-containing protein [Deltaproteobacteria bacterium]|nr:cupin domain-containing protein [Deltaproteobacteria bacterium]
MEILKLSEVPKKAHVTPLFTSPDVTDQSFFGEGKDLRIGIVNFGRGVRNKWHTHSGDQILIVTEGKGLVMTDGEKREVTVGDAIFIPAGEKHWHGATPDSTFSHITVQIAANQMTQLEA